MNPDRIPVRVSFLNTLEKLAWAAQANSGSSIPETQQAIIQASKEKFPWLMVLGGGGAGFAVGSMVNPKSRMLWPTLALATLAGSIGGNLLSRSMDDSESKILLRQIQQHRAKYPLPTVSITNALPTSK